MKKLQILTMTMLFVTGCTEFLQAIKCEKGWVENKDGLSCHLETEKDRDYEQRHDNANRQDNMMAAMQQQSFVDQFNALAAAGVTNITNLQIPTINPSIIPFIPTNQVAQFSTTQIPSFNAQQIAAFTSFQITAMTDAQLTAFLPAQVSAMLPAQIAAMTSPQILKIIDKMQEKQIQGLTMSQVQALDNSKLTLVLPKFTTDQAQYITTAQIAALGTAVTPQIGNLSPVQFAALTQAQIQTMKFSNPDQFMSQLANITATQLGWMKPLEQISLITTDHINNMTKDQLTALSALLKDSSKMTTTNNPNLVAQISAISSAPGKGVQANIKVAPKKKEIKYAGQKTAKLHAKGAMSLDEMNKRTGADKLNRQIDKAFRIKK